MAYILHTQYNSPNTDDRFIKLPAGRLGLHWWGRPIGQNPFGVCSWLSSPASQVSAHDVIWPNNVAQLLEYNKPAWASGNYDENGRSIAFECDPNDIEGTIPTIIERAADLVRNGILIEDFTLYGHKDVVKTTCPGGYYPRLAEIRQAIRNNLDGVSETPKKEEEDMMYVISCQARGIALIGPGHFAPCANAEDVHAAIRLSKSNVLETGDPNEWDRWYRLMVGRPMNLAQEDIDKIAAKVSNISAAEVAKELQITTK